MLEDCTLMFSEAQVVDRIFLLVSVTMLESWLQTSARGLLLDVSSFFSSWTSEVPHSCKAATDTQFLHHVSVYPKKEVCILSRKRLQISTVVTNSARSWQRGRKQD